MTESAKSKNELPLEASIPDGVASLESILCTEELRRRSSRTPDYAKENRALAALESALADSPRTILQTLAETILEITQSDTAGLSLLSKDGGKTFYWPAIAGRWKPHIGGGTPRNFGPCGDVLDRNSPLLMRHIERRYTYFQPVTPLVEEALLVPFYVGGKAVGTIWAVMHDDRRKFDAEDERVMGSLGKFASSAHQTLVSIDELKSQIAEREKTETTLRELNDGSETQVRARTAELKRSEFYLAEGQRLAHTGSWAFNPSGFFEHWSQELFRIYGLDPAKDAPTLEEYLGAVHPQDRAFMAGMIQEMIAKGRGCDVKKRILRPDGELRYVRCVGVPVFDNGVLKSIVGTAMDVTEQEHLTQELQRREAYLAEAQRLSHTGSLGWSVTSGEIFWSEETFRIFEYDRTIKPTVDLVLQRVDPEDAASVRQTIERACQDGKDFEYECRLLMPDGSLKYIHVVAHALSDESGNLEFVGAVMDVTAERQAEDKIREQEMELRQILDLAPQHVAVLGPDGSRLYANQVALEYLGVSPEEWRADELPFKFVHPDDRERMMSEFQSKLSSGSAHEIEVRFRRNDGKYRWFLSRLSPLRDQQGRIMRWYAARTDIEDRKQAEERLQHENVALREEIAKASMSEEIVGASAALQAVLAGVAKVAPTDSTVLITGETGTGKELIARAIHKRSRRSSRAFVSVNCAVVPPSLIASELFGHEKGAFTGALQRRLGRFELAEGGTIFLDEIGELPAETQIALLRVLQEREFERVGGNHPIRADVRVIAATNRDLQAAIAAGTFRSDLFYRLNVFPLEMPPLRERKEDIPMLVEYFIDRYASKAGKKIRGINKNTLNLLQSYPWPGNIRELQNVIERAVIVCETESLSVEQSWLSRDSLLAQPTSQPLSKRPATEEKELIEAALAEARGRVSGPSGAAVALGMPASTLESKIRSLKINKYRFKKN